MKLIKIVANVLFLSVFLGISTYAQVGQSTLNMQTDLSIVDVTFPDTIQIGETVVIEGFVKNESDEVFESDILLNYDIEDTEPEDYEEDEETDEEEILENVQLQPGQSIAFSRSILVNSARFVPNTNDIVIVWPETHRIIDSNTTNNYGVKQVFVKDAPVNLSDEEDDEDEEDDDEEDDDEEDDDEEEELERDGEEDENEDDNDDEDEDDNEKNNRNNIEVEKDKKIIEIQPKKAGKNNRIVADLNSAEIEIIQQNRQLKININNRDMEVLNFSLYTFNGHLLFTDKAHEYLIRQTMDLLPVISVVNYRLKSSPNKVNTFTKSIILK